MVESIKVLLEIKEFKEVGVESDTCSVCQSEFLPLEIVARPPCKHLFHNQCFYGWVNKCLDQHFTLVKNEERADLKSLAGDEVVDCPNCKLKLRESKHNADQQNFNRLGQMLNLLDSSSKLVSESVIEEPEDEVEDPENISEDQP